MFAHSPKAKYANKRQFLKAQLAYEAQTPTFVFIEQRLFPILSQFGQIIYSSPRPVLKFNAWNPVPICCDTNICTSSALLAV